MASESPVAVSSVRVDNGTVEPLELSPEASKGDLAGPVRIKALPAAAKPARPIHSLARGVSTFSAFSEDSTTGNVSSTYSLPRSRDASRSNSLSSRTPPQKPDSNAPKSVSASESLPLDASINHADAASINHADAASINHVDAASISHVDTAQDPANPLKRKWFGAIGPLPDKEDNSSAEDIQPVSASARLPDDRRSEGAAAGGTQEYAAALPGNGTAQEQPTEPVIGPVEPIVDSFAVTQAVPKVRPVDVDGSLRRRGRRKILVHKHLMQVSQVSLNAFAIFATWRWTHYYYILLPLITATVALNVVMVVSVLLRLAWNRISPEEVIAPPRPERLVLLVPCYNETKEELVRSLDSLVSQVGIDENRKAILIVCDGRVRGPGMEKTTADHLLDDILTDRRERTHLPAAYTAWDQQGMDVVVQRGVYQGLPYFCVVKQQNQGKRDSLIVARSFLYKFNTRREKATSVFSSRFFASMASFLIHDAGIDEVDSLIGMDADTVFDDNCIKELLAQSRYPNTVGVCGYVAIDWKGSNWDAWRLYQSAEYTIAQGLRRLHQSLVTHKVSCLPGCCQLLKIREETCGDRVLVELFGYCPTLTDGLLRQIRATASEDRNHVCLMLAARPQAQTRQALRARAYTDVPHSWAVFLSQRRRWTLGATSNDLYLSTAPGVQWFERILAFVNVMTWFLNPFIFASIASFVFAITVVPAWIIMCFVTVMLIPITYYVLIPTWLHKRWLPRFQFWVGCAMYIFCGPFINIAVLCYATWYMDSFGWGKTRKVVTEPAAEGGTATVDAIGEVEQAEGQRVEEEEEEGGERRAAVAAGKTGGPTARSSGDQAVVGAQERLDASEEERRIGT